MLEKIRTLKKNLEEKGESLSASHGEGLLEGFSDEFLAETYFVQ